MALKNIISFVRFSSLTAVVVLSSSLFTGCSANKTPVVEDPPKIVVYRAINRKNATYAKINDTQWRIDPDGLSTFEQADLTVTDKPCLVAFPLIGGGPKPTPGTERIVSGFYPYQGEYTPVHGGPGHWSIHIEAGHGVTDASDFTAYVLSHRTTTPVTLPNPLYTGKSKSKCLTPDGPNLVR